MEDLLNFHHLNPEELAKIWMQHWKLAMMAAPIGMKESFATSLQPGLRLVFLPLVVLTRDTFVYHVPKEAESIKIKVLLISPPPHNIFQDCGKQLVVEGVTEAKVAAIWDMEINLYEMEIWSEWDSDKCPGVK